MNFVIIVVAEKNKGTVWKLRNIFEQVQLLLEHKLRKVDFLMKNKLQFENLVILVEELIRKIHECQVELGLWFFFYIKH